MFKPQPTFTRREPVPEGSHVARLISFVDLGIQEGEWEGNPIQSHKVYLTFELPNEMREFDGLQKPMVIGKEFTFSMHEKAKLRPIVHALIGTSLTDAEAENFDFEGGIMDILGKPAMISVSHKEGKNGVYAKLDTAVSLPKGMQCPPQFNENTFYLIVMGENETFNNLPQFLKDKIAMSKSVVNKVVNKKVDSEELASSIPF